MYKLEQVSPVVQTIQTNLTMTQAEEAWKEWSWKFVDSYHHQFEIQEMESARPFRSER